MAFASIPKQDAVVIAIEDELRNFVSPLSFLSKKLVDLKRRREFTVEACRKAGMLPIVPQGGHCMLAGWPALNSSGVDLNQNPGSDKGEKFANWMSQVIAVVSFSAREYYDEMQRSLGVELPRFCYKKGDETLSKAAKNL